MMTESNIVNNHSVIDIKDKGGSSVSASKLISGQNLREAKLVSLIQGKLPQQRPVRDEVCIFRVPDKLRSHSEKDFVPNLVSIGPFHRGRQKLEAMEEIKLWNLRCFLDQKPNPDTNLGSFVKEIISIEPFCRNCYDEKFDDLSSDEFVEIMVVDGCFIIALLWYSDWLREETMFRSVSEMYWTIRNDLLLLENQIPWKVLDCLFSLSRSKEDMDGDTSSLNYLARDFFEDCTFSSTSRAEESSENRHLLDTVRNVSVGSSDWGRHRIAGVVWNPIPSVTELLEIGVQFQCHSDSGAPLLDITFRNGVMTIPKMIIPPIGGESLLRNLIAYEQCAPRLLKSVITSYVMLFSHLIKSAKDLDFLIQKEIIVPISGKEDAAFLLNRPFKDFQAITPSIYDKLEEEVRDYYESRWIRRGAVMIKRDYLYNPSSFWSVSNAVVIILILSMTQTIYAVLSYYKSSSK